MNKDKSLLAIIAIGLLIPGLSLVCSATNNLPFIATATPYATYTPYPTYTPAAPTATPIAPRWSVRVLQVIHAPSFGDLIYKKADGYDFLVVTLTYTYTGQYTVRFYPSSLVLMYPEGSWYAGFSSLVHAYEDREKQQVFDFYEGPATFVLLNRGETRTDRFAWTIPAGGESRYKLLFPELEPIELRLEN